MARKSKEINLYGRKATKARKDCMKGIYDYLLKKYPTQMGMGKLNATLLNETKAYLGMPNECAWTDRCCENVVFWWKKERHKCKVELVECDKHIDKYVTELEKYI